MFELQRFCYDLYFYKNKEAVKEYIFTELLNVIVYHILNVIVKISLDRDYSLYE